MAGYISSLAWRTGCRGRRLPMAAAPRFRGARSLCSSAPSSSGRKADGPPTATEAEKPAAAEAEKPASEVAWTSSGAADRAALAPSPDLLQALRDYKPPNADDYAPKKIDDEDTADLALPNARFTETLTYKMEVAATIGRTEENFRKHERVRRRFIVAGYAMTVTMICLLFVIPGNEEVDEVTGDIFRRPPGYVDLINDFRRVKSRLMKEKFVRYTWP